METKNNVIYQHNPQIGMPNQILDQQANPINEKIEVIVDKTKLQVFGWLVGALLSILCFFMLRVFSGVETLKENSEDFKTYIKTNDQRFQFLEQRFLDQLEVTKALDTRIKALEDEKVNYWKQKYEENIAN